MPEANNEVQCFYQNLIDIGFGRIEDVLKKSVSADTVIAKLALS